MDGTCVVDSRVAEVTGYESRVFETSLVLTHFRCTMIQRTPDSLYICIYVPGSGTAPNPRQEPLIDYLRAELSIALTFTCSCTQEPKP